MKALISARFPRVTDRLAARLAALLASLPFIVALMATPAWTAAVDKPSLDRSANAPDSPFFESGASAADAEGYRVVDVALSAGGRLLAIARAESELSILDLATSRSRTVGLKHLCPGGLAWAPDGSRLACVARREETGGSWDVMVVQTRDGATQPIAAHEAKEFDPVFSPDGAFLYFCSTRDGAADIFRCRLDSGETESLVAAPYDQIKPRPSPEGARLAYISYETGTAEVFLAGISEDQAGAFTAGKAQRLELGISPDAGPIADIQWAPGGSALVIVCRLPQTQTVFFYPLDKKTLKRAATIELPDKDGWGVSVAPLGGATLAFIRGGHAVYRDGGLAGAQDLTPGLPAECSLLAADAASGRYAAVLGGRFVAFGSVQVPGASVWFGDKDAALGWAWFLAQRGFDEMAIAQLQSLAGRTRNAGEADRLRLQAALLLRDLGGEDEAWNTALDIFNQKARDAAARRSRGEAARMMGEIALFDYGDKDLAAKWFTAASDFLTSPGSGTPVCYPQALMKDLSPGEMAAYVKAANRWRKGSCSLSAGGFSSLLKQGPAFEAFFSEAASVFRGPHEQNFLRRDVLFGPPDPTRPSPALKYQVRVAEAYFSGDRKDADDDLAWLCVAPHVAGDDGAAREQTRRLIEKGLTDKTREALFTILSGYACDTGMGWRRGWTMLDARQARSVTTSFVENVLLASAVKSELAVAFAQGASPSRQLVAELADFRKALRRGHPESLSRQQRFIMDVLQETPDSDRNDDWRLMAMLATGLTAEGRLRRGEWPDAREALEKAMSYHASGSKAANAPSADAPSANAPSANAPSANAPSADAPSADAPSADAPSANAPSANAGIASRYHDYLSERVALLFEGSGAGAVFGELMEIENTAVNTCLLDPAGAPASAWKRALRSYAPYLGRSDAKTARPVVLCLMADAHAGMGYPREQVVLELKAALACEPSAILERAIRERLSLEFDSLSDPYLAQKYKPEASAPAAPKSAASGRKAITR